jgi:hypothetical protein
MIASIILVSIFSYLVVLGFFPYSSEMKEHRQKSLHKKGYPTGWLKVTNTYYFGLIKKVHIIDPQTRWTKVYLNDFINKRNIELWKTSRKI